ncbi:MAG: 50S ribosomal protein L9 [Calditrichaeota bacterium]|nr:50S ribosomal protein L9 [Calditrichota bacterium]RQV93362.1 MAG: 50S ribosomal protein L9 [bacterium]RQW05694.1 MAG: 50S ribosomal protein L9 [Calditrichota bacterium]
MKIILRQDFEQLGKTGDKVEVKRGYGMNYLIPKKIAYPATPGYVRMVQEEQRQKQVQVNKQKKQAEITAKKMENVSVTLAVSVGEGDKMFGSVTNQDIAEGLNKQGFDIDRKKIVLDEPIKALGIYSVPIKLHPDVEVKIKVWVVKE